jgi:hypothetical protein
MAGETGGCIPIGQSKIDFPVTSGKILPNLVYINGQYSEKWPNQLAMA